MRCPKCGHEQPDGGLDCVRCGIVFSRYRSPSAGAPAAGAPAQSGNAALDRPRPRDTPPSPGSLAPLAPMAPPEPPATTGSWQPAVVGTAMAGHRSGAGPGRSQAWPGAEQIYGGPDLADDGGAAAGSGAKEIEVRHELTGRLYEGPPSDGEAAAVGMALRPAPRDARPAGGAAAQRFSYGAVMRDTASIFAANLVPFLLIAAVPVVPLAVAGVLAAATGSRVALLGLALVGLIELVLAGPLVTGAITFGVAQELRHREASIGGCLARALSSVLAILGVAFLQSLVVLGGLFLCIVPGLVAGVMLCVAVPAALEERRGVMAALHSSADLTRGHRWQVAGVLLTFAALQYLLARLALLVAPGGPVTMAHQLPSTAAGIVGTALQATAGAVMYYRLRSVAAGVEVAALPSIFD